MNDTEPPKLVPFQPMPGLGRLKTIRDVYEQAETSKAKDWLWQDMLLGERLAVLGGFMKEGKSTFLYALISAIATGRPFLNRATRRSRILVVPLEEHPDDVAAHFRDNAVPMDEDLIRIYDEVVTDMGTYLVALRHHIRAFKPALVVIDTLSRLWKIEDENDNAEALRKLGPILDMCRSEKVAILLVHHTGKGQPGVEYHGRELRGASALFGIAEQSFILKRQAGTRRLIKIYGRIKESPSELLIDFTTDGEYVVVSDRGSTRLAVARDKVMGAFRLAAEDPGFTGFTAEQACSKIKVRKQTGTQALKELVAQGSLMLVGKKYCLADASANNEEDVLEDIGDFSEEQEPA